MSAQQEQEAAGQALPSHASVVIIGGGSVGCSIAWHLVTQGMKDVVLLEKNELTSGSTWHAAGNCPNFVGSWTVMKMQHYSLELYRKLGELTDYPMNYHVTGSVRLAHSRQRMEEFAHVSSMARQMGFDLDMMSNADMKNAYPFMETHDLEGGLWDPYDGDIDPAQLTQAFAKGARDNGAKIIRFCPVTSVDRKNDEWVITTPKGQITCEKVVNAAGYRAAELGRMFGRDVPCVSLAHQYLITEGIEELASRDEKLPLLRDPDSSYYLRQEKDGLLLGPYEKNCRAHWVDTSDPMPEDFSFQLYPDDLERLEWYIEDACARVPLLGTAGITRVVNGPIPYTPDGLPLIGPMPGVPNAFEACVFTFGIVQAGGAGKLLSEWILHGETETDSWAVDPRRFTDHVTHDYAVAKALEVYSHEYAMHFPHIQWEDGRPADNKTGEMYNWHREQGAEMGSYGGWERAEFYPPSDYQHHQVDSYDRQPFFDIVAAECRHVSEHVGILDLPGFTRFEVSGAGASAMLERLMTNKLPSAGRTSLAYFASDAGKIVSEMSITRFDDNHFWLISGAGAYWHDRDLLNFAAAQDEGVTVTDRTYEFSTFLLTGPKSRDVMAACSPQSFETADFPWLTHQDISIAGCSVRAIRVSFTGELGWELHIPVKDTDTVFAALMAAGADHNLKPFGMLALDSMRLEKGYRSWKGDLTSDYNMFDSGLGRWVHFSKPEFVGRDALNALRNSPHRQFVTLKLEDPQDGVAFGEAVYLSSVLNGDKLGGLVLSAGYGHRTGQSLALAVLEADCPAEVGTKLSVEVVGRVRDAEVISAGAVYDADNSLLKG